MHDILPALPDVHHNRVTLTFHPKEGTRKKGRTNSQGDIYNIKVRAVCQPCNSGWMNRLEDKARPILTELIQGNPVALDHNQTGLLASWVAMKCMILEHSSGPVTAVTPRADRVRFKATLEIPPYYRIYAGSHKTPVGSGMRRDSQCIGFTGVTMSPPLGDAPNNIHTVTLILGRVLIYLVAARIDDFDLESRVLIPALYQSRIWPHLHDEMVWPRNPIFDTSAVDQIAGALGAWMNAQGVKFT